MANKMTGLFERAGPSAGCWGLTCTVDLYSYSEADVEEMQFQIPQQHHRSKKRYRDYVHLINLLGLQVQ